MALGALGVAAAVLAYVSFGDLEENLVYYWSPAELLHKGPDGYGASVRLGGVVEQGSMDWSDDTLNLTFRLSMVPEPGGIAVPVVAKGAPPQMFRESIGAVVEGHYDGAVFEADRVMVKHSNEYQTPGDASAD